jgi:hypothetical protein
MDVEQAVDLFVPGRLCVLGEHTDWAGQLQGCDGGEYLHHITSQDLPVCMLVWSVLGTLSTAPEVGQCAQDGSLEHHSSRT